MVGRTIGKYRIVEQVGRGGMGTVFKAVDETLDRTVAIKVLNGELLEQEAVERFRREALTLARLNHPRIGAIHELARDGHDFLMVMEFVSGETFEAIIERAAPLPIPQAIDLCTRVLEALDYSHRAGVVHRDLKPANVIVTPAGDVKVMDFGIARVQGSEHLTTYGFMVGTPAYMPPEQVRGEEVDPRMDLYAVAVVLYRLLTDRLPFHADTAVAMIHSQLHNPPTPPRQFRADLPDWLVMVLTRGLAKSPGDRFQTAEEFRKALEDGLSGKAVPMPMPTGLDETIGPMLTPPAMPVPAHVPIATQAAAAPAVASAPAAPSEVASPVAEPLPKPVQARMDGTVTLRTPHLATVGIIVALLLVGIGVLAFMLLRQPASETSASASNPATPAATVPAPPSPPVETPPAAPPPTAAVVPASSDAEPKLPPANASPAQRPATAGAAPSGARRANLPAIPSTPLPVTPLVPAVPSAADAPAQNFGEVRAIAVEGGRGREVDATLFLEPGNLVIRARGRDTILRTLPYSAIGAGTYLRGKRPRGQKGPNLLDVPENLGSGSIFGSARHWLTLQTPSEFLVVRLEDRNVIGVINNLEARTGITVSRERD